MDEVVCIFFVVVFLSFFIIVFFEAMASFIGIEDIEDYICLSRIYGNENSSGSAHDFSIPYYEDKQIRRSFCHG